MTTLFLCRANGEGSHEFRVAADEAAVMVFYEEMFGLDMDGKLDGAIEHFRDSDNWSNEGTAYHCELYCATFEVWKVGPRELMFTRPEELSAARGCPCLYTTPCKDNCTCVSWTSSAGCARCCTYGSLEQRTKNAERLASLTPSPPLAREPE